MRKRISVLDIKVLNGENYAKGEVNLIGGNVKRVAILVDGAPSSLLNVKISDSAGGLIHPAVSYKEYQPTNGNHKESRKELEVSSEVRDLTIEATSRVALTADFEFQMVFYTE